MCSLASAVTLDVSKISSQRLKIRISALKSLTALEKSGTRAFCSLRASTGFPLRHDICSLVCTNPPSSPAHSSLYITCLDGPYWRLRPPKVGMISGGLSCPVRRNRVMSLHCVACCCRTNFPNGVAENHHFLLICCDSGGKEVSRAYTDLFSVSFQGGRGHTWRFSWWVSWDAGSRMAVLIHPVSWQGWLEGWPLLGLPQNSMEPR